MIYRMNMKKRRIDMLLPLVTMLSIMLFSFRLDETEVMGLVFVLGIPLILMIVGFIRSRKVLPRAVEFSGNRIVLSYAGLMSETILLDEIDEMSINVHSVRTAYLELLYKDDNLKERRVILNKKYFDDFIEMCQSAIKFLGEEQDVQVYGIESVSANIKKEYDFDMTWDKYLTQKKTFSVVLEDIKKERFIRKLGALAFYFVLFMGRVLGDDLGLSFIFWMLGIGYLLYLIVAFVFRLRGYSRRESIEGFVAVILLVFLGGGSLIGNVVMLFGYSN